MAQRHGRVLRQLEIGEFLLSDVEYRAGSYLESHHHPRTYISVLIDGSYTELCDGLPRVCAPGTVIVHPQREEHADYFLSAGRCINVDVPAQWIRADGASGARRSTQVFVDRDARIAILNAFTEARPGIARTVLERALRDLTAVTRAEECRLAGGAPAWLPWLLCDFPWIEAVPLADAALAAGVHQTHFTRVFRKHVGMTAGEYRKRARLRRASHLLLGSPASLTNIADAAGFSDQSHFTNAFRSTTGMAPGAYRGVFSHLESTRTAARP